MVLRYSAFGQIVTVLPLIGAGILGAGMSSVSHAQATPRITEQIETSPMQSLPGQVHPWARKQFDRGLASSSTSGRMIVVLKRSQEQQTALQTLLSEQQDSHSSNYHKWLTPEEFGKRFGVAESDVQTVSSYLSSHGMSVGRVAKNRMTIEVGATTEQVRATFGTEIHAYVVGGKTFYANSTAPKIPTALSKVVSGFASLNNFQATGGSGVSGQGTYDRSTRSIHPLYSSSGSSPYGVAPADLSVIYDIPSATGTGKGGTNVNIGVVGDSNINVAYVNNYRSVFNLGANPPTVVIDGNDPGVGNLNGTASNSSSTTTNNDEYIAYKQLEILSAVAPKANLYYYVSATTDYDTGLDFALVRAVDDNTVQVLVNGFQSCETALGSHLTMINNLFEQAAAQGMTIVAASGNSGSAGCEVPGGAGPATTGYAVNGYASSPYVTAVGGTDFYYGSQGSGNYWNSSGNATKHSPEQAWNDSISSGGTSVELASGGGISTAGLDGVSQPQPIPSYQSTNSGVTSISSSARVIPDVSFFAGTGANDTMGYNQAAYVFCMKSEDCNTSSSTPTFTYAGGTEASSALFAGAVALTVNKLNSGSAYGLGNVNPTLYSLFGNSIFGYDITIGSNELACSGSSNCTNSVMTGYATKTGYDAATGLGSLDIASFVSNYNPSYKSALAPTITFSVTDTKTGLAPVCGTTPNCTVHSTPLTVNITATGTGTTAPTGDVAIMSTSPLAANGVQGFLTLATSAGTQATAKETNLNVLPGGTYNLYARYGGDSNYAPAVSSSYTITVTPEACGIVIYNHNISTTSSNMAYGSPVTITAEPYSLLNSISVAAATGSMQVNDTFGGSTQTITTLPLNNAGSGTFTSNLLAFGQHSIVLNYPGDASFKSCASSPFLVNITKAATTTTLLAPENDPGVGGPNLGITAIVKSSTTPSNGTAPTGTVTFNTTNPKTLALTPGFDTSGNAIATVSTTIGLSDVPASGSISATYNPAGSEVNYTGSTSSQVAINSAGGTSVAHGGDPTVSFTIVDNSSTYNAPGNTTPSYPAQDSMTLNLSVSGARHPEYSLFLVYANGVQLTPPITKDSDGFVISGGLAINSDGTATFVVSQQNGFLSLPSGQVQLSVIYDGWYQSAYTDSRGVWHPAYESDAASANQIVNIVDDRTSADFSLQSDTTVNSTALVSPTTSATYNLRLTSIYNFQSAYNTTPINLSCTVKGYTNTSGVRSTPSGLACGFDSGLTSTTTSTTFSTATTSGFLTLPLYVGAASGSCVAVNNNPMPAGPGASPWWFATGGTALACIFLFGVPARRRNWQSMLGACVFAVIGFGMTGCGTTVASGKYAQYYKSLNGPAASANCSGTSVPTGVYTVVVTATTTTNTTLVHTLSVQVKVGS